MERLTDKEFNCMGEFCDAKYCPNYEAEGCSGFERYHRLKAYEDTGLEPEQVKDFVKRVEELARIYEKLDMEAFKEILRASEDGRLFMTPVKVGDMLWVVYWDEVLGAWGVDDVPERVNEVGSEGFFLAACLGDPEAPDEFHPYEEIGKEFFLTREKAVEAAAAKVKEVQGEKYAYITYECHRCKRKTSRKIDMSSVSGEDIARLRLDICPICGAKMMKEKEGTRTGTHDYA